MLLQFRLKSVSLLKVLRRRIVTLERFNGSVPASQVVSYLRQKGYTVLLLSGVPSITGGDAETVNNLINISGWRVDENTREVK